MKQPQDATLRNIRAARKEIVAMKRQIRDLQSDVKHLRKMCGVLQAESIRVRIHR